MSGCTDTKGRDSKGWIVVGPGAIGILFAVKLERIGLPVAVQTKDRERTELLQREGIFLLEAGRRIAGRPLFFPSGAEPPFLPKAVLVSVKAYDTNKAVEPLLKYIPDGIPFITLQNGLTPIYSLKEILKPEQIFLGITQEGARRTSINVSVRSGKGRTWIGAPFERSANLTFIEDLKRAGFDVIPTDEIWGIFYKKLLVSLSLNPLTAISKLTNGGILEATWGEKLLREIVGESLPVLIRMGFDCKEEEAMNFILDTINRTRTNKSSMLQDIEDKRPTEVDEIVGEFVKRAKTMHIKTPLLATLHQVVLWMERSLGIRRNKDTSA
jgi:2-dehydropantoate 2-reductase